MAIPIRRSISLLCWWALLALPAGSAGSASAGPPGIKVLQNTRPPLTDRWGDLIPQPAIQRYGTIRYRADDAIWRMALSPSGKILASAGDSGYQSRSLITLWDTGTEKRLKRLAGHRFRVYDLCFAPGGSWLASCAGDGTVRIWDPRSGKETGCLRVHDGRVYALAVTSDGRHLVTGGEDKEIGLWDVRKGTLIRKIASLDDDVRGVAVDPKCRYIAGSTFESLHVWDFASGKRLWSTKIDSIKSCNDLLFSPSGTRLVFATGNQVSIWDVTRGKPLHQLRGHTEPVVALTMNRDGTKIATTADDNSIRIWDSRNGKAIASMDSASYRLAVLLFAPEDRLLAAGRGGCIQVWDCATGKRLIRHTGHEEYVTSVAIHPTTPLLASGSVERTIRFWDQRTGKQLAILRGHADWLTSVRFSPSGKLLLSTSHDGTLRLWRVSPPGFLAKMAIDGQDIREAVWSPDEQLIASRHEDGSVVLWDVPTRKKLHQWNSSTHYRAIAFSGSGTQLALADSYWIDLVDVKTRKVASTIRHRCDTPAAVLFCSQDKRLVLVSGQNVVEWRTLGRDELTKHYFLTTADQLSVGSVSPDGRVLALGTWSGRLVFLELSTGSILGDYHAHHRSIRGIGLSPDGRYCVTGGRDSMLLLWPMPGHDDFYPPQSWGRLTPVGLAGAWDDLADPRARVAWDASWSLTRDASSGVTFLRAKLLPSPGRTGKQLDELIRKLNDADYRQREAASGAILGLGYPVVPALRSRISSASLPLETVRRLKQLLTRLDTESTRRRLRRAVMTLEAMHSPPATRVLQEMARHYRDEWLAAEAVEALDRLPSHGKSGGPSGK